MTCTQAVREMLNVLDRIRRELRGGLRCSEIITAVEEGLVGHGPCAACTENLSVFRREFVPLTDTVLPGDAHECHAQIAKRHGIKPPGP